MSIDSIRNVSADYWGERGRWVYDAFEVVNRLYFNDSLPVPLIQWALTPHGHCLGLTAHADPEKPVITLHPAIWGTGKLRSDGSSTAWGGIPAGRLYTFDVLVHELTHVAVRMLGGKEYFTARQSRRITSHDNQWWPAEVERVSPLLGLEGIVASRTKRARVAGKMARVASKQGSIAMQDLSTWPHSVRPRGFYDRKGKLPW